LRQTVQSVDEETMDVLGRHSLLELIRVCDTGSDNHLSHLLDDQIDRLHHPSRLLRDRDGKIPRAFGFIRDPLYAQIPDGKAGSHDRDGDAKRTTKE
jgi:hypothetical protein